MLSLAYSHSSIASPQIHNPRVVHFCDCRPRKRRQSSWPMLLGKILPIRLFHDDAIRTLCDGVEVGIFISILSPLPPVPIYLITPNSTHHTTPNSETCQAIQTCHSGNVVYTDTYFTLFFLCILRMYSIYERKKKILIFLLLLTFLDYALQMSANHAATSIYLSSQNPNLSVCFIIPTNLLYSLVFISPTVFHHIILVMTLYKSILHIRTTREGGIKSIMQVVQRDQILFVLAICLINFSNMVLVFQGSSWPYRLVSHFLKSQFVCTRKPFLKRTFLLLDIDQPTSSSCIHSNIPKQDYIQFKTCSEEISFCKCKSSDHSFSIISI